jgi:hypothetical protein
MHKITKNNVLDDKVRRGIWDILLKREMTAYDVTQVLYGLGKGEKRKWSKRLYDKVKYHLKLLRKFGYIYITRREKVSLASKEESETASLEVIKIYYKGRQYPSGANNNA